MSALPRVLLLGGTGQVGWELRRSLAPLARLACPDRAVVDLRDERAVRSCVRDLAPAAIVNAAAYTDVERAEAEPEVARAVNARAPAALAEEAERIGAPLLHLSTDYVLDGRGPGPAPESHPPAPLNVYGCTKLEGERGIGRAGGAHLILRVAWVYGLRGHNFLRTVLERTRAGETLRVVDDQRGSPTWSRMVSAALASLLAGLRSGEGFSLAAGREGVYHLGSGGETTWYGFARAILEHGGGDGRADDLLVPIRTAERPAAPRPPSSLLSSERAEAAFGVRLPDWREQLALCLAERDAPR
jgi:dTDP-4-dehydrorhamnose reductase